MNELKILKQNSIYSKNLSIAIITSLILVSGIFYIVMQWKYTGDIIDTPFVSMLVGASILLLMGLKYLTQFLQYKGRDFYSFVLATDNPEKAYEDHKKFFNSTMNPLRMTTSGIFYGILVGCSPFILDLWKNYSFINFYLALFLFLVNFATGVAFYSLIMFYFHSFKMGKMIKIDLWQVNNPSTRFLLGATRRISILASIYVSICLSSILFSVFPISELVITYSIFACIILLSSLIIPTYPVVHKLKEAKEKNLNEIDSKLNKIFYKTLSDVQSGNNNLDLKQFDVLFQLRERIDSVTILPFKSKSFTAAFSIILLSLIPVIVQIILERYVIQ